MDADRFAALLEQAGQATEPRQAVELIREALRLWRGEPYQGLDMPELTADVRRLTELRLAATEDRYAAELRCGRHAAIVADLTELVDRHPLRERLHALLMTALYRAGRQADALAAYRDARLVLVEELGVEPGAELRELEATILAGEPLENAVPATHPVPAQLPRNVTGFVGRSRGRKPIG
ncbi:AfsR/SARP family transcriptional regulator [Saccharopolyspora sp. 5N708]|uniref:AfsR/SARP family transcriptional regulator n=1 Tax=Saccharopolyspora sp. 5N708 TaxID=3457424 RepID=UPI003FCF6606